MVVPRYVHTATALPDGHVVVAGGADSIDYVYTAELYDPGAGFWSLTGNMNVERYCHTATLLTNGEVLVANGYSSNGTLSSAELYNP
ncbi:unnamed protein product [Rotaria magnacalcarata]